MKTALFLFAFFSLNFLIAQSFDFPTSEARWRYNKLDDSWKATTEFSDFYMSGDSIINGLTYQIIGSSHYNGSGFLRTEDKKVYFIPRDSTDAYLLYDFNLVEGDTFINRWSTWYSDPPDTLIIQQVDSILVNNELRKKWLVGPTGEWIEGIGSTWLLTKPYYEGSLSGGYRLFCFREDGDWIIEDSVSIYNYYIGGYDPIGAITCEGFISSAEETLTADQKIKIHPSPYSDRFEISSPNVPEGTPIQIYSVYGVLLQTIPYEDSIMPVDLPAGTYVLSFKIEQKLYTSLLQKM